MAKQYSVVTDKNTVVIKKYIVDTKNYIEVTQQYIAVPQQYSVLICIMLKNLGDTSLYFKNKAINA